MRSRRRSTRRLADATIAISHATIEMYRSIGIELVEPRVIHNAVDPSIFHPEGRIPFDRDRPIRLICSSWSDNPRKGAPDLPLARGPPRLGPVRVHLRREHADAVRADPAPAAAAVERARGRAPAARHLRHRDRARRVLERARRGALVRPAGGLPRQRRQPRGREGGRLRVPRARGDPGAARSARRRVRAAPGADLAAVARGDRRPVPRDPRARRVRGSTWRSRASSAVRRAARPVRRAVVTRRWRPASRLFLVGEGTGWVDRPRRCRSSRRSARSARRATSPTGASCSASQRAGRLLRQPVHAASRALAALAAPARHGLLPRPPGHARDAGVRRVLPLARRRHEEISRVQVSHSEMHEIVVSSGIDPGKVFRIPIGVEPAYFEAADGGVPAPPRGPSWAARRGVRRRLVPQGRRRLRRRARAEGDQGPGRAARGASASCASGSPSCTSSSPGRRAGTSARASSGSGSPTATDSLERYEQIGRLYQALDAYVVPSRQEGGPKGVFEAMASGVPVVTTRVGQAMDLVRHGENAWMVDVDDAEGLAHWLAHVAERPPELPQVIAAGLETAAANTYEAPASRSGGRSSTGSSRRRERLARPGALERARARAAHAKRDRLGRARRAGGAAPARDRGDLAPAGRARRLLRRRPDAGRRSRS